ncbi:hypothetical protein CBR_g74647 [Chara braunii]|uniref:Uncharacterized protein n=1 Tax=Chara braunii TaxID=69332 RepID=A0A388KAB3_CHABU|nr:hypothetical protein CBR_g74647 [Chara braunii]|eukprot:GBG66959.1 hypothetical protein CBR_g74647 [Chara braunii]
MDLEGGWRNTKQWGASQVMKVATPWGHPVERVSPGRGEADGLSMPNGPSVERGMSPASWPADELLMPGRGPGDCVQDKEGPASAEGGDAEVAGRGAEDWRVGGGELVRGGDGGGVLGDNVVEEERAWRGRCKCGLVGGEDAVEFEGTSEEVGERHWGLVGKGGRQVFAANTLNVGDESEIVDDVKGDMLTKRADVLHKTVGWSGLLEPTKLVDIVVDRFLWAEGGGDEGGPLKEGVSPETGVMAIRHFGVPPTSSVVHKSPASDEEPVDDKDAVEGEGFLEFGVVVLGEGGGGATMVEVVVDEGGGVQVDDVGMEVEAEPCPEEGVGWGVEEGGVVVVTTVMAGEFPSSMVTRSEMAAMVVLVVVRKDLRTVNVWRIVPSSRVVVVEVG